MSKIPAFFLYTAPSTTSVMLLLTLGLLILAPVAFAGFSVLARPAAHVLTACYLVANLALLIPTRDPNYIAVICFIMMSALMYFDHRHLRGKSELRTIEGTLSRFMQYVPFGILLARNLSLHAASSLLNSSIFALIAVFLFCIVPAVTQRRGLAGFAQGLSLIPASISWGAACEGLFFSSEALLKLPNGYIVAIFALPIALLMVVMSFFTVSTGTSYRHAASVLAMFAMISQLASMPGVVSSFLLIATGIVCMVAAYMLEEKLHLYMGGFGLLIGLLFHVKYAMRLYYGLGPWLSLAILGVGTLLLAAYLEKNHRYVLAQFGKLRLKLSDWR